MNRLSITSVLLSFLWIGCAPLQSPDSTAAADSTSVVRNYKSLVAHLRSTGLTVEAAGEIEQPFFSPKAKVVRIGATGEAQIYDYASEEKAAAEAKLVNSDGSIGTSMPHWFAPPHFFRKGSLIVLYLGSDERTLSTLRETLGSELPDA